MKILIIDPITQNEENNYIQELMKFDSIQVTYVVSGEDALNKMRKNSYDVIITELIIPGLYGPDLVKKIRDKDLCASIYVYTYIKTDDAVRESFHNGADFYFLKPFDTDVIIRKIIGGHKSFYQSTMKSIEIKQDITDLEAAVSLLLLEIGVPSNLKGYTYLIMAIVLFITDRENFECGITKWLYPAIAKKHKSTIGRVERNIRSSIEKCWERSSDRLIDIFGLSNGILGPRPTNSAFITSVGTYLKEI